MHHPDVVGELLVRAGPSGGKALPPRVVAALPDETVAEVVRLFERANDQRDDAERRRREISGRIERIAEMYKWGDVTREAYRAERERLEAELATLRVATSQAEVLVQAADFLKDLPTAWAAANPEQRNALAGLVFETIEIEDDRVVAVVPQPDFAPFFVKQAMDEGLLEANDNGATKVTPSIEVMNGRKRRALLAWVHTPPRCLAACPTSKRASSLRDATRALSATPSAQAHAGPA